MRWLFSNAGKRMKYALQNPRYALKSLVREITSADERFLSRLTRTPAAKLRSFLDEPLNSPEFAKCLREAEATMNSLNVHSADLYAKKILVQYVTLRALKPKIVVETGVANGVSSSYLLLALEKNGVGTLCSVEVGDRSYLPEGKENGWIVPEFLRHRWQLKIGDAKELLPKVLAEMQPIDVFIHDSLHTYEQMMWEFKAAYPFLRCGGILLADDAMWNNSFHEFADAMRVNESQIIRGVGVLRKP